MKTENIFSLQREFFCVFLAQSNQTSPDLVPSNSVPPPLTSPEKPDPERTLVCKICFENFNGNWGLVHGQTMHGGYCEGCAERPKKINCLFLSLEVK